MSVGPPASLAVPPQLSLFMCRHGERVDQVFGTDWLLQAFRSHQPHGEQERAQRDQEEKREQRKAARLSRKLARRDARRHSQHQRESSESDSDDASASPNFSFSSAPGGSSTGVHHASYVRFNLNMPKDTLARLPRRDIAHYADDAPLTECGHWQASLVGEALLGAGIQTVYCSPALRCVQTAHEICQALGLVAPSSAHAGLAAVSSPAFPGTPSPSPPQSSIPSLVPTPPKFMGIRIEFGLYEWMGWVSKYPRWLSAKELAHAGLAVDQTYTPCSLRPKQGETQREWYERSSDTMQRILQRHFGVAGLPSSNPSSVEGSRRGSEDLPPLTLGAPHLAVPPATSTTSASAPLLYTHGNILFVAHAGSLDTLSYGLLHQNLPNASPATATAPSQDELDSGKRMRLFSNYCGIGRIQYVREQTSSASSTANSRRNSLAGIHLESIGGDTSPDAGRWQICDDSTYDMTNSSNDPFSFQLSYQSYQSTMARMTETIAAPPVKLSQDAIAALMQRAQEARDAGADAIVLSMPSDENGDAELAMPAPSPSAYLRAHLAPAVEPTPDLSFRASFGHVLDACNGLANFLRGLGDKQREKLTRPSVKGASSQRSDEPLSPTSSPLSPPSSAKHRTSLSHGAAPGATIMMLHGSGVGPSASLAPVVNTASGPSVLDSWLLLAVSKTSSRVVSALPEWAALRAAGDQVPLHVFRVMVSLRRYVTPLRRWTKLPRADKNLISWLCMLHHIAPPNCARTHTSQGGGRPRVSATTPLRCDFQCALSSCIVGAGILSRQGFARKIASSSSYSGSSSASRELQNWISRADAMRSALKRDGPTCGVGSSSRPSSPPPGPSTRSPLPVSRSRDDSAASDDLLRAVLLAPIFMRIIDPRQDRVTPVTEPPVDPAVDLPAGAPTPLARYQSVLLANSAHEYTTSLASSSSLPMSAAALTSSAAAPSSFASSSSHALASLVELLPRLLSPRLFECLYLFSLAHASAEHLAQPAAQIEVATRLQRNVIDLRQSCTPDEQL